MQHDPRAWLEDIEDAAAFILGLASRHSLESYVADRVTRDAVSHNFVVIGEALRRLRDHAPHLASRIPDTTSIIGFRNVVIHGYDIIEDVTVWGIIQGDVPRLLEAVRTLLQERAD